MASPLSHLDAALLAACPLVAVPRHSPFESLTVPGHRVLCAANGTFVEICRPWLHAVIRIGDIGMPLPYGELTESIRLRFSKSAFAACVGRFAVEAAFLCPLEHAAWFGFSEDRQFQYLSVEVLKAKDDFIQYERPNTAPGQVLAVDCHTHGADRAFFSETDDEDDRNDDVKLALVVGNLDQARPTVVMRLSAFGMHRDLTEWARQALEPIFNDDDPAAQTFDAPQGEIALASR